MSEVATQAVKTYLGKLRGLRKRVEPLNTWGTDSKRSNFKRRELLQPPSFSWEVPGFIGELVS